MTSALKIESRSRMMKRYGPASAKVSRNCCTTQSAEGCRVTFKCRILRRPCSMMNKQYNTRKVAVGTVKRSRVQRRLACSVGDRLTGVKVRSPVAWIAERRETDLLKPIDE